MVKLFVRIITPGLGAVLEVVALNMCATCQLVAKIILVATMLVRVTQKTEPPCK
jgi:hypothetical protein